MPPSLSRPTQRHGRHWLDVARYANNKGYKFFSSDELYAYTYRDWVIGPWQRWDF